MAVLDHVFLCVEPGGGPTAVALEEAGFPVARRRRHVGQGTANVCFQVGGVVVELLWVVDDAELSGPVPGMVGLEPRVRLEPGSCPLGIALGAGPLPVASFPWPPTFLPAGVTLDVARDSVDPSQPLVFLAPGATTTPSAGEAEPDRPLTVTTPADLARTPLLRGLEDIGICEVRPGPGWGLVLRSDRGPVSLPARAG